MIPVRDLCIDNWVYDGKHTQFPMYVQTIGEDYVYLNFEGNEADPWETTPEELQGIPLTESLLIQCGFGFKDGFCRKGAVKVKPCRGFVSIEYQSEGQLTATAHSTQIYYLHQLQNFVYAITRQQLKVNL